MNSEKASYAQLLELLEHRILDGGRMVREEADLLLDIPDERTMNLLATADRIRIHFKGSQFDSCSLINARAGLCAEDCAFCAQSSHYQSESDTYPLVSGDTILSAARAAKDAGASRFCTVTSGGALSEKEFQVLVDTLEKVHDEVDIALDASLGFLDEKRAEQAVILHSASVSFWSTTNVY